MNRQDAKAPREESWLLLEPSTKLDALAHAVIGAAIEVHRALGPGYLESVYEEALSVELRLRRIAFERQRAFAVTYKGQAVGEGRVDLLIDSLLVIELKAVDALLPLHKAQTLSYLKALDLTLGLLINFKAPVLRDGLERIIRSR